MNKENLSYLEFNATKVIKKLALLEFIKFY